MGLESTIYDLRNVRAFYLGKAYGIVCALHDALDDSHLTVLLAEDTVASAIDAKVDLITEALRDRLDDDEWTEWRHEVRRVARFLVEAGDVKLENDSSDFDMYAENAGFIHVASVYDLSLDVSNYDSVEALRAAATNRSLSRHLDADEERIARIGDTEEFWFLSERRDVPLYTDKAWLSTYYYGNHVVTDEQIVEHLPSGRFNPGTVWRKHPRAFSAVFGSWLPRTSG